MANQRLLGKPHIWLCTHSRLPAAYLDMNIFIYIHILRKHGGLLSPVCWGKDKHLFPAQARIKKQFPTPTEICYNKINIKPVLSPVGAAVARSLDMGKVTGSIPVLGTIYSHPLWVAFYLYHSKTSKHACQGGA